MVRGGGGGEFGHVFLTFFYGYNTASNNSAWKGVWGPHQEIFILELEQNPVILDNSGGYTSLVIMSQ